MGAGVGFSAPASSCSASPCSGSSSSGSSCAASSCSASSCAGSSCAGSSCAGSSCTGSSCTGSSCTGSSCTASSCAGSSCAGSSCPASSCPASGRFTDRRTSLERSGPEPPTAQLPQPRRISGPRRSEPRTRTRGGPRRRPRRWNARMKVSTRMTPEPASLAENRAPSPYAALPSRRAKFGVVNRRVRHGHPLCPTYVLRRIPRGGDRCDTLRESVRSNAVRAPRPRTTRIGAGAPCPLPDDQGAMR